MRTFDVLKISKATRKHLEKALAQVAIESGEEEAFFAQHLVPKGDIPRTVLLKPGVISFSAFVPLPAF